MDLRPNQMLQRLRDGTLDFAITSQQHTQRLNLDWEALSRMQGLVVCRKNNPLRHSHSLRQLQFANWISLDAIDDHSSQFYQMFEENEIPPPQRITECSSVLLALDLLHHADAFMTLSEAGMENSLPKGLNEDLMQVKIEELIPEYPIYLVCLDRNALTTTSRDLYFAIRSVLSKNHSMGSSR
jgi:DNA-binding transcriptional LysR family regulator